MFSKPTRLIIRLECQGHVIGEASSDQVKDFITIGRSRQNTWVLPADDRAASSNHARLYRKGKDIHVVDCESRNGIFHAGKKITERKLLLGDQVQIGESILSVTFDQDQAVRMDNPNGKHKLEGLNGVNKGRVIELTQDVVRVGSDPDSEIHLQDFLISRRHAELIADDKGECWVSDLKSANGTFVNRVPLSGKKRVLKDGDVVSFAFMDFRFLHKAISHTRSYFWTKIMAVGLTLVIATMVYVVYLLGTSSPSELIRVAKIYAAQERFKDARKSLADAANAHEAGKYELERESLLAQIDVWEKTAIAWQEVQVALKEKRWIDAVRGLTTMRYEQMENWNWNDKSAIEAKNQAAKAKRYLDVFLKVRASLTNPDYTIDDLKSMQHELEDVRSKMKGAKNPLFSALDEACQKVSDAMVKNLENLEELNKALTCLEQTYPNFKTLVSQLVAIEERTSGTVQQMTSRYLKPIRKMQEVQDALIKNALALSSLRFDEVKTALELPTVDECAVNPFINSQRTNMENINKNFQAANIQITHLWAAFQKHQITPPRTHKLIQNFCEEDAWVGVFACDSLKMSIPKRNRTDPQGIYDRLVGVEYFYELLRAMPEKYDDQVLEAMSFKPECVQAKMIFMQYVNFINFVNLPENKWLLRGEILKVDEYCHQQLAIRDRIVQFLFSAEPNKDEVTRRSLIGRCVAIYLASDSQYPYSVRAKLAEDFKQYRVPLVKLNNEYDSASPEKALELRDKILSLGLPGDPIVRRMWATRQD